MRLVFVAPLRFLTGSRSVVGFGAVRSNTCYGFSIFFGGRIPAADPRTHRRTLTVSVRLFAPRSWARFCPPFRGDTCSRNGGVFFGRGASRNEGGWTRAALCRTFGALDTVVYLLFSLLLSPLASPMRDNLTPHLAPVHTYSHAVEPVAAVSQTFQNAVEPVAAAVFTCEYTATVACGFDAIFGMSSSGHRSSAVAHMTAGSGPRAEFFQRQPQR